MFAPRTLVALPLIALALAASSACARRTPLPGLQIGSEGTVVRTTAEGTRMRLEGVLATDLRDALSGEWGAAVEISPDPSEDLRYDDAGRHWRWSEIVVVVGLRGPAGQEPPLSNDAIGEIVGKRLKRHLSRPELLRVRISRPQPAAPMPAIVEDPVETAEVDVETPIKKTAPLSDQPVVEAIVAEAKADEAAESEAKTMAADDDDDEPAREPSAEPVPTTPTEAEVDANVETEAEAALEQRMLDEAVDKPLLEADPEPNTEQPLIFDPNESP
ncbi:MAG: hypothetical protein PF961_16905 [Planctomycetota bacterium]|jgi:hypothetical protein|nr:hypothetical protein [Planctomycetota bacterium]